ncbi:hypothetical protein F2Q69_00052320 [Brassica cretica]|uniref:Uncharacterized protein n=1 Tax=Brassica cretica TaxID=69181 RepID=A0A8S9MZE4_BRACR|nr:hypothetical protein F2Q69_00052320 [Brassica cretica]
MNSKRRTDGMRGHTKVAEWPLFPNQIVAGCDSPVQQRGNLELLLDMTHKTNGQGRLLGANHTKKTRKVLIKEQRVKTQKFERKWNDFIDRSSSEPSGSFAVRSRRAWRVPDGQPGKAHAPTWFQHDPSPWTYARRDTRLGSDGPKGKDYGLSRFLLNPSEFRLDHQSWLGELVGKDGLRYGRFGHLDVVLALVLFRLRAGRSGTRLGVSVWNGRLPEPRLE